MTTIPERRTAEEIENLKRQYLADPCWDVWNEEGFEAHEEELRAWAEEEDRKAEERELHRQIEKSIRLGVPGATGLVEALEKIERRLDLIEGRLDDIGENTDRALYKIRAEAKTIRRTVSSLER